MITIATLKTQTWKDLAELARRKGLSGYHSMRKDELVKLLARSTKAKVPRKSAPKSAAAKATARNANGASSRATAKSADTKQAEKPAMSKPAAVKTAAVKPATVKPTVVKPTTVKPATMKPATLKSAAVAKTTTKPAASRVANRNSAPAAAVARSKPAPSKASSRATERIQRINAERERLKDLSGALGHVVSNGSSKKRLSPDKDRVVLMVRDSYWIQACWQVLRPSIKRAEAALAEHWHTARPILRLLEVDGSQTTSTSERVVREIDIHGGVNNWYIDVNNPPQSYRVDLGYLAANGKFYALCRSNAVTTPLPDSTSEIDENWTDIAENYEKVYALSGGYSEDGNSGELRELFEERLRRPMGPPNGNGSQFGMGADRILHKHREFQFQVDAEMIIYGSTKSDARVTLAGEPVKLRNDGTFTIRLAMPDKRQVLPVVAASADGNEQRTIVIAVERNTKVLEPMVREVND